MRWTLDQVNAHNARVNGGTVAKVEKVAKYRNKRCMYKGIAFDSKKEMCRFADLLFLQEQGIIHFLNIQVRFKLSVCTYIADMVYFQDGEIRVEDVKSAMTRKLPVFSIKRKMMMQEKGIEIKLV